MRAIMRPVRLGKLTLLSEEAVLYVTSMSTCRNLTHGQATGTVVELGS